MLSLEKRFVAAYQFYQEDYNCLSAIEKSLKTHAIVAPRGYLDFLIEFFANPQLQDATAELETFD